MINDPRAKPCTSCQAPIIFLPTPNGKRMPIDAASVALEDTAYDPKRHKSHFATCTDPAKHRKPR